MSTPDWNGVVWRTSSYTASTGNCVEVAPTAGTVLVRDTKDREGPVLAVPATAWRAFLADIPRSQRPTGAGASAFVAPATPVGTARRRHARMRRCATRVARPVTGRAGRALWRPTTGRGTGHRSPRSRAAHRSGPRMIGGRIYDDTVLVGFALGRLMHVLAAGKLACPVRAAPLTCAAGYVLPRDGPSRCGLRPPSAPTPETRYWAPSRGGTPPLEVLWNRR